MAYPYYQPFGSYFPQQAQQPASGILWVSGISEAQMYPVAPNNAVALWDQSGKAVFLKQADATGKPSMRIFDITERAQNGPESFLGSDVKQDAKTDQSEIRNVLEELGSIKEEILAMKTQLCGKKVKANDPE